MKQILRKTAVLLVLAALLLSPQSALAAGYEAVVPQYSYDDSAAAPVPADASSRYVRKDGIYTRPDAESTGEAVLMITGDLMCQYRQQNAAFISSGKDYISAEEYQTLLEQAIKKQAQAVAEQTAGITDSADAAVTGTADGTDDAMIPSLTETPVDVPPLDLGVIPQPEGTWDFRESFQYARQILRKGDLVIGNLETMVSQSSPLGMQIHRLEGKPYLNAPASYLDALKYAGYDLLTMANNHNVDTGLRGIRETLQNVENWNFMHTGLFSSEEEDRYLLVEVNGIRIGIVSYASYFNEKDSNLTAEGQNVLLNRYGMDRAKADIRAAKKAGAEFILAFIHWGAENTHETTWNQEQYARTLARAGADYIVGSHPHALQRYDIIETSDGREVPVIYSMGNFLSSMQRDINNDTLILQLNLERDEEGIVRVVSHRIFPCAVLESVTLKSAADASSDASLSGAGASVDASLSDSSSSGPSAASSASSAGAASAGTRTASYVIVPQQEAYRSRVDTSSQAGRENLKFLDSSLARTLDVFSGRTVLPLPYDPYDVEGDEPSAPLLSPKGAANHLHWILSNAAARS